MTLADPAHFYERASRSTGAQAVLRLRIGRVRRRCGEWCGWIFDISQPLLSLWHLVCNRTELSKCRPHLFQQLHRWHRPALSVLAMLLHVSNNTFHMNALVALSLARDLKTRIHNNEKLAHNTQMVPNTEWRVLDCVQSVFLLRSLSFLVDLVATLQSHTTRGCFSSIPLNRPSPFSRPLFLRPLRPRPPQLQGSPPLGRCTWQHRLDQTSCLCTAITKATPPQTSLSSPQKTWSESNRFSVRLFYFQRI